MSLPLLFYIENVKSLVALEKKRDRENIFIMSCHSDGILFYVSSLCDAQASFVESGKMRKKEI